MPVASGKWSRLVSVYVTLMLISFSNVHAKDLSTSGLRKVEKTGLYHSDAYVFQ